MSRGCIPVVRIPIRREEVSHNSSLTGVPVKVGQIIAFYLPMKTF